MKKRALIIGGNGTIGKAVVKELSPRYEIIIAGRKNAEVIVDITDVNSIKAMYEKVKNIDAVVITAGEAEVKELENMTDASYRVGLNNKLMGQVNVVLEGLKHINDKGSFTLTSGILGYDPALYFSGVAMVNSAIDGFVLGASIEMPRGIRINSVSPGVVSESMEHYAPYFRGYKPVPASHVALFYSKSVEGLQNGKTYRAV
jgi:NAD(P)-dependent dehydrogenase (short-subunit alcohol dehydrogenase family)